MRRVSSLYRQGVGMSSVYVANEIRDIAGGSVPPDGYWLEHRRSQHRGPILETRWRCGEQQLWHLDPVRDRSNAAPRLRVRDLVHIFDSR